jgi:DNA-binding NarL/FixJ family response regulator
MLTVPDELLPTYPGHRNPELADRLRAAEALFAETLGLRGRTEMEALVAYGLIGLALVGSASAEPGYAAEPSARRARRAAESAVADMSVTALTLRELDVLKLVAQGLTNPDIARRLVLSVHTVRRHVANILHKLNLSTRAAAAAWGVRAGLV